MIVPFFFVPRILAVLKDIDLLTNERERATRRGRTVFAQLRQSHLLISPADNPLSSDHVGICARVYVLIPSSDFWRRWHVDPRSTISAVKSSLMSDQCRAISTARLSTVHIGLGYLIYSCNSRSPCRLAVAFPSYSRFGVVQF